jgi:hypothetical protein
MILLILWFGATIAQEFTPHNPCVPLLIIEESPLFIFLRCGLCNINVQPKVQLFLWLLSHNKLAMVDNLNKKKGMQKPEQCVFCAEKESIIHLFFYCNIAKVKLCQ